MLQTSAGHKASGSQDPVTTGMGSHASPVGELRNERRMDELGVGVVFVCMVFNVLSRNTFVAAHF